MVAAVADHPLVAAGASFLPNKPAPPRPPRQPPFPGRPQPAQPPHSVPFSRDLDLPPSSTSQLLFLEQSLQPPGAPLLRQQLLHEDPLHAKHASYSFSVPSSAILSTSSPLDSASSTSSPLPWHHFLYFSTDVCILFVLSDKQRLQCHLPRVVHLLCPWLQVVSPRLYFLIRAALPTSFASSLEQHHLLYRRYCDFT
ncbi:hypothetical protein ACQJBY_015970 [Aegilops geniculata]